MTPVPSRKRLQEQSNPARNQAVRENGWEWELPLLLYSVLISNKKPWSLCYVWEPLPAWFASFCVIVLYMSAQSWLCCHLWTSGTKDVTVMAVLRWTVLTANTQTEFVLGLENHTGAPGTWVSTSAQHFYHQYKHRRTTICVWQRLFTLSSSGGHHLKSFQIICSDQLLLLWLAIISTASVKRDPSAVQLAVFFLKWKQGIMHTRVQALGNTMSTPRDVPSQGHRAAVGTGVTSTMLHAGLSQTQ